jgi:hypothetical protein
MWYSPFSKWIRSILGQSGHPAPQLRPNRCRLSLEPLEDRALLSQVFTVTNTLNAGAGSLRAQVAHAGSGDQILFAPALTGQTIKLTTGAININKQLTISGPGALLLTISGSERQLIFLIGTSGNVSISGLTLTDARTAGRGGAIQNNGALTLTSDQITSNSSLAGGAVYNTGSLTISNSTLSTNSARTGNGGAIFNHGTLNLTASTLSNNNAITGVGGGISNTPAASATISNCTFAANHALNGGALFESVGGTMSISESTIATNSVAGAGGGIRNAGAASAIQLTSTIIATNKSLSGHDVFGAVTSQGFNLVGVTNGSSGWVSSDLTGKTGNALNPLLGPLANNGGPTFTFALLPGSPALMNGNPSGAPATDQRGFQRVVNGKIDIGAFENQPIVVVPPTTVPPIQQGTPIPLGAFSEVLTVPTPWNVTAAWGDGTNNQFTIDAQGSLGTMTHNYAHTGNFTITVTVTDQFGDFGQASFRVTVASVG